MDNQKQEPKKQAQEPGSGLVVYRTIDCDNVVRDDSFFDPESVKKDC